MNFTVYLHENTMNGKRYVGYTKLSMEKRWQQHVMASRKCKNIFARAILKYGEIPWHHIVLEVFDTKEEAKEAEIKWIAGLETYAKLHPNKGYNLTTGGDGGEFTGKHHTIEARQRLSIAHKRKIFSSETRQKLSIALKTFCATEHGKMIRSLSTKGKIVPLERRKKISETLKRSINTPEYQARLSRERTGRAMKDATKEKISNALRGRRIICSICGQEGHNKKGHHRFEDHSDQSSTS